MMSRRERMKERKRMWRTEQQDCFIWSVRPGSYQPWQMMAVSTLIVGWVICGLDKPLVQNMLLFMILNNCGNIPAESSFEYSEVSFKISCALFKFSLVTYHSSVHSF